MGLFDFRGPWGNLAGPLNFRRLPGEQKLESTRKSISVPVRLNALPGQGHESDLAGRGPRWTAHAQTLPPVIRRDPGAPTADICRWRHLQVV